MTILTSIVFSQEKKVFNGKFQDGNAEYEYYINENYDKIYDGFIRYYGNKYVVEGYYKDNQPEGKWVISANDQEFEEGFTDIQSNTKVTGTYEGGLMQGIWTYKNSFALQDYKTGQFKKEESELDTDISSANFNDNIFVGKLEYRRNFQPISVEGTFNSDGLMIDDWIYKTNFEEDIIKYNKGIAYWRLVRNLPSNDKVLFIDNTEFVEKFWNNYDKKTKVSVINDKVYFAQKVELSSDYRIRPSAVELTNSDIETNRRDYKNPALKIWQDINVDVYQSYSVSNPLYYGVNTSNSPKGYEILIKECTYSVTNGTSKKFTSNKECIEALNKIKAEKEVQAMKKEKYTTAKSLLNQLIVQVKEVDDKKTEINEKLNNLKPTYPENYENAMKQLKQKFNSTLNETIFTAEFKNWSIKDDRQLAKLKEAESNVKDYVKFQSTIKQLLDSNDKKTLKILKNENASDVINTILNI